MDAQLKKGYFVVNGTNYDIPDEDDISLGDAEEWEGIAGVPFGTRVPSARVTLAWLYLAMRHAGAKVTVDQLRALKNSEWDAVEGDKPSPPVQSSHAESNGGDENLASVETPVTGGNQPS